MLAIDEESLDEVIPGGLRLDGRAVVIGFVVAAIATVCLSVGLVVSQRVTPHQKSLAQARLVAGLKLMLNEDHATAVEAFDEALAANPALNSVYGWRAEAYLALGDVKAAVTDFDTAIKREVSVAVNRGGRGEAALRAGRYAEAVEDFDFAIAAYDAGEIVAPARPPEEAPDPRRRTREELAELRETAAAELAKSEP